MRRPRAIVVFCGCIATAALLTSCGHRGPPSNVATAYAGPLRSRDIARGGHIFRTFCNPCHAGRVTPEGYGWSPAQMRRQIREGNRQMPPIRPEYLSGDDLEAVLAFLTVIGAVDAPLPAVEEEQRLPDPDPSPDVLAAESPEPTPSEGLAGSDETAGEATASEAAEPATGDGAGGAGAAPDVAPDPDAPPSSAASVLDDPTQ